MGPVPRPGPQEFHDGVLDLARRGGAAWDRGARLPLRRLGLKRWRGGPSTAAAGVATPSPPPGTERLPVARPLPEARYLFVVGAVPANFGGRTASILQKCRLLKELAGVNSTIVTLNYTSEIEDVPADLRRRGLLVEGVDIVNLHDYFERDAAPVTAAVHHELDEPGMERVQDPGQGVHRYYQNGVCRLSKRFDDKGRLLVREWFDENQSRTRRDELGSNGLVRRMIELDPHNNRPRQETFYRSDGTPCMRKRHALDPATGTTRVGEVTLLDADGRPAQVLASNVALKQLYLDTLIGNGRAFLTVESRRSDQETLTYRRPNVKQIYVLHNPHLAPRGDDPSAIRPAYQPLFEHQDDLDAIVFLTNAQRADAEAYFGERKNFRVVPHPVGRAEAVSFGDRDPNLVVMLARLDQQKQISDAITAFAHVVEDLPAARLEIYGEGADRDKLQGRIDALRLGGSVTLMGYTKNADAVYQRAALSILTSKFEGFGLVLLESLAQGCPVISYDVKYGPSDIIVNGVNGYLVEPRATAQLADRVVEVLRDEPLRRRLSDGAARLNAQFSQQAFVARWADLFGDLDAEGWG